MFEAHRNVPDASEVYHSQRPGESESETEGLPPGEGSLTDEDEWEEDDVIERIDDSAGKIFLTKPNRSHKARNAPGAAVSAQKGAVGQFRHIPNTVPNKGAGRGKMGQLLCWRCGRPDHTWRAFHRPYNPDRFSPSGNKGKGKSHPGLKGIGNPYTLRPTKWTTNIQPMIHQVANQSTPQTLPRPFLHHLRLRRFQKPRANFHTEMMISTHGSLTMCQSHWVLGLTLHCSFCYCVPNVSDQRIADECLTWQGIVREARR